MFVIFPGLYDIIDFSPYYQPFLRILYLFLAPSIIAFPGKIPDCILNIDHSIFLNGPWVFVAMLSPIITFLFCFFCNLTLVR